MAVVIDYCYVYYLYRMKNHQREQNTIAKLKLLKRSELVLKHNESNVLDYN